MRLIEAEGKTLLKEAGVEVPDFLLIKIDEQPPANLPFPVVCKAQTLTGGRGKAGLVKMAATLEELPQAIEQILENQYDKRPFESILIEPRIFGRKEYYLSFAFDTHFRSPVLIISRFGGMDIEIVGKRQPNAVIKAPINYLKGLESLNLEEVFQQAQIKEDIRPAFTDLIAKLYAAFLKYDAELIEVNPLIEGEDGKLVAADAKVILNDDALYRHEFLFPRRTGFRPLTEMEAKAREIDGRSHRGVVGRTFLELDGDIAVMSSGGGASITCLDALISYGGRPACFAEYSGNPEREDVRDLAKLILNKERLRALWVVGPTANFTDVYETLGGIMDALKEVQPGYPVIIRRAGPRAEEAKQMVTEFAQETGLDITFYGEEVAMTESAKILMDKIGPGKMEVKE